MVPPASANAEVFPPSPLTPFIPHPDVRERHELIVHASAAVTMAAAERFDMHSIWIVSATFRLRAWFMRAVPPPRRWSAGLMDEVRTLGWGELARQRDRFVVMGAVAQPWLGNVRFQAVPASEFREYSGPQQVKIAWTLEAIPLGDGRTCLRTETRVAATDAEARRLFLRYWRFARFGIIGIRWVLLPAVRREAERSARLPGDSHRAA
jgi:hypothetical protein